MVPKLSKLDNLLVKMVTTIIARNKFVPKE
jgi:hypothetical protein